MTLGLTRLARLLLVALTLLGGDRRSRPGERRRRRRSAARSSQFLGQQIFPTATQFQGTAFGGLSGFAYDHRRHVFYALSDDQVGARFYTLRIGVSAARPAVEILGRDDAARRLRPAVRGAEPRSRGPRADLARHARDHLGGLRDAADRPVGARVRPRRPRARAFPVPSAFLPVADGSRGVRQNLGFESAGVDAERPLPLHRRGGRGRAGRAARDARRRQPGSPAPLRPRAARRSTGSSSTGPTRSPSRPSRRTSSRSAGSSRSLPLDKDSLLTMERSFSVGAPGTGNTIRLYQAELGRATDVNGFDSLATLLGSVRPAEKTLAARPEAARDPARQRRGDGVRAEAAATAGARSCSSATTTSRPRRSPSSCSSRSRTEESE